MLLRVLAVLAASLTLAGPAVAQPVGPGDPAAFVADLFKAPDPEPPGEEAPDAPPVADEAPIYASSLHALMVIDSARENNYLDFDWVWGGQDLPQATNLKIKVINRTEATAQVRVTFRNYSEARERLIDMVVEDGRWVIEDVYMKTPEKEWLSRRLVANPQD